DGARGDADVDRFQPTPGLVFFQTSARNSVFRRNSRSGAGPRDVGAGLSRRRLENRPKGYFVMRAIFAWSAFSTLAISGYGQDSFKVSVLKEPPPASLAADVRSAIADQGFRIQDDQGRNFADIWLRKAIPSTEKPGGPKGTILFPFLADGEMLGVLQFAAEGHDYRDQPIAKGIYTIRYGLQPVNGDHLGVSTYRDYSLLLPAAKDQSLALPPRKQLEGRSAESAGTSHP